WRIGRCRKTAPGQINWKWVSRFDKRRQSWQRLQSLRRADSERNRLALHDQRQRRCDRHEIKIDAPCREIIERSSGPKISNVRELYSSQLSKSLTSGVGRGADPDRAEFDVTWIRLGGRDQVGNAVITFLRSRHQHTWLATEHRHRRKIMRDVVWQRLVQDHGHSQC